MRYNSKVYQNADISRNGGEGMSFDLTNCRRCGRLFHRVNRPICPDCEKALEEKYQEVKQYIRENEHVTIVEVSKEMDVSVEQLKKWVREERLYFQDPSASGIECLRCGKPIAKGKYCPKCADKMANQLGASIHKEKEPEPEIKKDGNKMRFLDK